MFTIRFNRNIIKYVRLRYALTILGGRKVITLKQARILSNMNQKQAAKKIGVSITTISNWERRKSYPDALQIKKIEKIYNVGFADINF